MSLRLCSNYQIRSHRTILERMPKRLILIFGVRKKRLNTREIFSQVIKLSEIVSSKLTETCNIRNETPH